MRANTIALVALMAATAGAGELRAQEYTVADLGTLGGTEAQVSAINESGQATGYAPTAEGYRAYRYSAGTMRNLGTIGGSANSTWGFDINASGHVVGAVYEPGGQSRAFLYDGTALVDIGSLGGISTWANGINAGGAIVGMSSLVGNGGQRAFVYSGGTMTALGTLGGNFSSGSAINDSGQVTGYSSTADGRSHAFLYSGGTMRDLSTLGGDRSVGVDVSPYGQVVGFEEDLKSGRRRAFLHDGVRMIDLGTLGGDRCEATAINAWGDIVGECTVPEGGPTHGFLYRGGVMVDLNDLVPADVAVTSADDINSSGQIAANGRIGLQSNRAMILTPIVPDRFAYAWADSPTAASYTPHPSYAYNSTGGAIHIDRQGVGIYNVSFEGLPGWGAGLSSAVAVTAYGSTAISCSSLTYSSSPGSTAVLVGCFDAVGQRMADSRFTVMVVGNQSVPTESAFVMSGGAAPVPPPSPAWSWTSGHHPITVTHQAGAGLYDVLLGTGNTARSAKLVTATTGGGTRCNNQTGISGGLRVRCYDWTGAETDQGFSVIQIAGGRPGRRVGFAVADRPTTASYTPATNSSFNSSGGAITATRWAVGRYTMNFAALQKLAGATEHVQVAAIRTLLTTCNVVNWGNSTDGLAANIECRNGSGQFVDTRYHVLVIE